MSALSNIRKLLSESNLSEFEVQNSPLIGDFFKDTQAIRQEMYEAIEEAIKIAQEPFLERIRLAEEQYAAMLRLTA